MGIPLHVYDGLPLESKRKTNGYQSISGHNLQEIKELYYERQRTSPQTTWSFEISGRVPIDGFDIQRMNHVRSSLGSLWIFFNDATLVVYDCNAQTLTDFSHIVSHTITCVDCYEDAERVWFAIGSPVGFQIVGCVKDGTSFYKEEIVLPTVVKILASMLPQYAVIVTKDQILVYTDILESLFKIQQDGSTNIKFPYVITHNHSQLHCYNTITQQATDYILNLKPEESVVDINPIASSVYLIETDQRFISVSPDQQTSVFNTTSPSQVVFKNNQLYVVEHHLYATSLTIYSYCLVSKQWQLQNYYDLVTKFNINKVDAMLVADRISSSSSAASASYSSSVLLAILMDSYIITFQ